MLQEVHQYINLFRDIKKNGDFSLEDLQEIIKKSRNLNCYLFEISLLKKLEKWALTWTNMACTLLNIIPKVKLFFKNSEELPQKIRVLPYNFSSENYSVLFNEKSMEFLVFPIGDLSPQHDFPQTQLSDDKSRDEENSKGQEFYQNQILQHQDDDSSQIIPGKRKRNVSSLLRDKDIALFNPKETGKRKKHDMGSSRNSAVDKNEMKSYKRRQKKILQMTVKDSKLQKKQLKIKKQEKNKTDLSVSIQKKQKVNKTQVYPRLMIEENPLEKYCICRKGHDGYAFMFSCDSCDEWFHGECLNIKFTQIKNNSWYCPGCCLRFQLRNSIDDSHEFAWNLFNKLTLEEFEKLYEEGKQIPLYIKEKQEIGKIKEQIDAWIEQARVQIQIGVEFQQLDMIDKFSKQEKFKEKSHRELEQNQLQRDQNIFHLILEGIYLCVDTEEFTQILRILQKRDFVRNIKKHYYKEYSLKQVSKVANRDYSFLELDSTDMEKEILTLYNDFMKFYQSLQKNSQIYEKLVEKKSPLPDFQEFLLKVELSQTSFEKIDSCKQKLEEYKLWEIQVLEGLAKKIEIEKFIELKDKYDSLICGSQDLFNKLNQIIETSFEWINNAWKFINEKDSSGLNLEQLIVQGQCIPCKLPYLEYLESEQKKNPCSNMMKNGLNCK